jgi:hypothetical protein
MAGRRDRHRLMAVGEDGPSFVAVWQIDNKQPSQPQKSAYKSLRKRSLDRKDHCCRLIQNVVDEKFDSIALG